jgi:hypothetical protein
VSVPIAQSDGGGAIMAAEVICHAEAVLGEPDAVARGGVTAAKKSMNRSGIGRNT